MRRVLLHLTLAFALLVAVSLGAQEPAWAQDGWSWIVTPQLWLTHIEKNGFGPASDLALPLISPSGTLLVNQFPGENSEPSEGLYPQGGLQVAAQRGRWTLAGSFQYVSFETRSDVVYRPSNNLPVVGIFTQLSPGERAAQEFVDTTRIDMDFAASYLFPDVVQDRLDLSIGAGFKFIYAEGKRQYGNLSPFAAEAALIAGLIQGDTPGLYVICKRDDCSDAAFRDRVKTTDYLYGATIPMSATVHLTSDAKWLLPISVTPFIGVETRNDRDVVYRFKTNVGNNITVDRLDGTTFAYGVTGDLTVRYLLSDTISIYGGGRVQYINGHEEYLAYGPIMGMSVRFGGK